MKKDIIAALKIARKALVSHPHLQKISQGGSSRHEWQNFISERFAIAGGFIDLLSLGILKAFHEDEIHLGLVLAQNLREELGYDEQGRIRKDLAHATWRENLMKAIGAEASESRDKVMIHATFCTSGYFLVGMILFLEFATPAEYRLLRLGLETDLPRQFRLEATDRPTTRHRKEKARQHLVDHEQHDATSHYPQLLAAVLGVPEKKTQGVQIDYLGEILSGIEAAKEARLTFYDNF